MRFLPYATVDGRQQVREDFALWRDVTPLYEIEAAGGFAAASPSVVNVATECVANGSSSPTGAPSAMMNVLRSVSM